MVEKPVLEGVRIESGMSMLARWRARRRSVVSFLRGAESAPERRRESRRPGRLKWGKTLDEADRFLSECLVVNRGGGGACLRLTRNIALPAKFQFFDDASGETFAARVAWRRGVEIGCRLSRAPPCDKDHVLRRMRNRYYAL
jgi:hypothetical protein